MGVTLNKAFGDGSVVALWQITEGDGKSLSEQRLAVDALIDSVFEGKERLCHNEEGIPFLEATKSCDPDGEGDVPSPVPFVSVSHTKGWAAVMTNPKEHVGIDIELCDRNFSAVEKKSLSNTELSQLDGWAEILRDSLMPDTDPSVSASEENSSKSTPALNPRNTVLGLIWCAKEAVYKRLTVPATDFTNQIEIERIILTSTDKVEITAIFKDETGGVKIHLNCLLLPSLLLVHTIN